ncbi:ribosome hibernation-promoting factor, HPF/YfiA family [Auraticoccus monumenti]|uniref:Ribosome hibernation promoting factor n=1 Tax=Auraticoccus monumenti TaxID=675864 RepID=A0A1G7E339_9ACTN|nr:ribosome-associated translation inhibitor RaiA [Auraticoccus monumenti]SDE57765.1 ribosomal subunit interface protein [Auraticoccus monumenti]
MDVVVSGRHCTVTEEFRSHVQERVTRIERLRDRVIRVEVEVSADNARNPDQDTCVQITLVSKGPAVRAESCAHDKTAAFERALDKLTTQLRKAHDRRAVHHRGGGRMPLREVAMLHAMPAEEPAAEDSDVHTVAGMEVRGDGPLVVREKTHSAPPMTLDQALDEMELVGHDFYLFVDAASGRPSVVYRRHAYDYGVIHLETEGAEQAATA